MSISIRRTITLALITFLLGSSINYLTGLEETIGLDTLFKIRSARPPPSEVVIVAMDEASETRFDLRQDFTRWRQLHAQLLRQLQQQGAALVVFDLQFMTSDPANDPTFAAAIKNAGNVLTTDCVQKLRRGVEDFYGRSACGKNNLHPFVQLVDTPTQTLSEQLVAIQKIEPTLAIKQAVLDHAPFVLTDDAEDLTVREGWLFLDEIAETPTLPLVTWLYYLKRTGQLQEIIQPDIPFSSWLTDQRRQCLSASRNTLEKLPSKSALQNRINHLICGENSRFLNFYGPPQTFRIESYSDVYDGKVSDLHNKVIFVGMSNRQYAPTTPDFFQTPFSNTNSGKMAGVEIMATQFANLLEDRFISSPYPQALWYLLFGTAISLLLTQFTGFFSIFTSALLSAIYIGLAIRYFERSGVWLPIAVPLLVQLPLSWLISLEWCRRDLIEERDRILLFIRQVFPQWLHLVPGLPGRWYPENSIEAQTVDRKVNGLCLATDIEGYTTLASRRHPQEIWALLKSYYHVLGYPVSANKGNIANIQGDAMMAIWIDLPPPLQRQAACLAALEIEVAVERFNQDHNTDKLPTRIGLHAGEMILGGGEAGGFKFYNPFGDTVAIASRIEGVNKHLRTKILASVTVTSTLKGILCRPVGFFRLVGVNTPLELMEIVGMESDISATQLALYEHFTKGLRVFQNGQWDDAITEFNNLLDRYGVDDGPTAFYLDLALAYQNNTLTAWDGAVTLMGK